MHMKLNTTIETQLPRSLETLRVNEELKSHISHNLEIVADAVFSALSSLRKPLDEVKAGVALAQGLVHTLDIQIQSNVPNGISYSGIKNNTLYIDSTYQSQELGYPEGIALGLEVMRIAEPAFCLRQGEDYARILQEAIPTTNGSLYSIYRQVVQTLSRYVEDSKATRENLKYGQFLTKWFGDSKPSYIEDDFADQILGVLDIKFEIIEGIEPDTDGIFLFDIYKTQEFKRTLLTSNLARLLQEPRANDAMIDVPYQRQMPFDQGIRSGLQLSKNLLGTRPMSFDQAYAMIASHLNNNVKAVNFDFEGLGVGLFYNISNSTFFLSYGNGNFVEVDPQEAWWCLVL